MYGLVLHTYCWAIMLFVVAIFAHAALLPLFILGAVDVVVGTALVRGMLWFCKKVDGVDSNVR